MKKIVILISFFSVYFMSNAQIISDIDAVSSLNDDLVAIQKNNKWAFMNKEGKKVIDFRNDLVSTENLRNNNLTSKAYPIFKEGRCLIKKQIDGINYYGYIDKTGNEIIAPQFINASNFENGYAIVIKFVKNEIGENNVLGKQIVSYKLEDYIIDKSGNLIKYLENPRNVIPSIIKSESPPSFSSKFIAPHLVAVKSKDKKWNIYKF